MYQRGKRQHSGLTRWPTYILVIWLPALLTVACQIDFANPPRLATATARAAAHPTETPAPVVLSVPLAAPPPGASSLATAAATENIANLTLWVNETSPEHEEAIQQMVDDFSGRHTTTVEVRFVAPALLPRLVETAVLSDVVELPDLILHPLEFTVGWASRGILDPEAADAVVDDLGRTTFAGAALDLVDVDGRTAAVPSDGFAQILLYRRDWFAENNLSPPDTYDSLFAAAAALLNPEQLVSGLVIPTESNLITTHQGFEHLALANGCQLIDDRGEVLLLEPACQEALDYYFALINQHSPSGVQTDTSALSAFLDGRTAMIMASPAVLPALAGLDEENPPGCPECTPDAGGVDHLARNSGIITHIGGAGVAGPAANFGNLTLLGITRGADPAAKAFAEYWFGPGYERWLAVESERKVPLRLGTNARPDRFISAWGADPLAGHGVSLIDLYGPDTVDQLRTSVVPTDRWGFAQGQGALITTIYEELTFSIVLQEMLSGYFNSEQTLTESYIRVTDLIPNYPYLVTFEPTPTP